MNELLGICESLEGYSGEDLGFKVLKAEKFNKTWELIVERYSKGLEDSVKDFTDSFGLEVSTEKYNNTLIVLAERLYSKYSDNVKHYEITNCSKLCKDKWCITIQELQEVEDEKSSC